MAKNKSIFYSERLERYFLSADDAKIYDAEHSTNVWAEKNSFDALTDAEPLGNKLTLEFTAKVGEYFRIWVVCHALTLLTLGIYGPWARTRKAEFLGRHWLLDGQSFQVRFVPIALLRGRILIVILFSAAFAATVWNPWLAPALTVATFMVAPWLLANSFAFRWRTLSHRGMRFDADNRFSPLVIPLITLGLWLALNQIPAYSVTLIQTLKQSLLTGVLWMFAAIFASIYVWSGATSALTHYRFSQARWGDTGFTLGISPKQLLRHTAKILFSLPMIIFFICLLMVFVAVSSFGNRDATAAAWVIYYLVLVVYATTFARGRRINFVLHRLSLGGMTFSSTISPTKAGLLTAAYAFLAVFTLGLSMPWSTVHFNRWRSKHIQIHLKGDWAQFSNLKNLKKPSSALDELGNSLDIEVGI